MKTVVGVYDSHDKAVLAIDDLKKAGYAEKNMSLMTKADFVNDQINLKSNDLPEKIELGLGIAATSVLGVLTGVGVFAIPGLGFLYGAGAIVGLAAGWDIGLMGAGVIAILTSLGIDEANSLRYHQHLQDGKFLVLVQGNKNDADKAEKILGTTGLKFEDDKY